MSGFPINTNIAGLISVNALNRTLSAQQPVVRSLATGLAINTGADGPAALISSQNLLASLRVLEAESMALQRSNSVVSVADANLGQISDLLVDADALAVAAANTGATTDAEREAFQVELDSIVQSIDRIAQRASFAGTSLFDGNLSLSLSVGDSLSVPQLTAGDLGTTEIDGESFSLRDVTTGAALDLVAGDPSGAQTVISAARTEIDLLRGELGAAARFTIEPRLLIISNAIENTAAATSIIRDTDFASATAELSRLSVLSRTGLDVASMANANPLRVLNLLTPVTIGPRFL